MNPKVSVIIPVYNTAGYIGQAIDSILAQTFQPAEVIVVDDGSSDNIDEAIQPYLDKIHFVKKTNGGISSSYNTAIKMATGDWIAICDGDDYWHQSKLMEQQKLISPEVGFIFCNKIHFNDQDGARVEFAYPENIVDDPLRSLLKSFFASPSTTLIRKELIERCGYFDTSLSSSEDYDLWIKIAAVSGYKFRLCKGFLTYKRIRKSSIQGTQGYKGLIPLVFFVLLKHKNLFKNKLTLTEREFYWHIGLNYGFVVKRLFKKFQLRLTLFFLLRSFKTSLVSGLGTVYRILFMKQQHIPWYK